jgi:hypothetical protein
MIFKKNKRAFQKTVSTIFYPIYRGESYKKGKVPGALAAGTSL